MTAVGCRAGTVGLTIDLKRLSAVLSVPGGGVAGNAALKQATVRGAGVAGGAGRTAVLKQAGSQGAATVGGAARTVALKQAGVTCRPVGGTVVLVSASRRVTAVLAVPAGGTARVFDGKRATAALPLLAGIVSRITTLRNAFVTASSASGVIVRGQAGRRAGQVVLVSGGAVSLIGTGKRAGTVLYHPAGTALTEILIVPTAVTGVLIVAMSAAATVVVKRAGAALRVPTGARVGTTASKLAVARLPAGGGAGPLVRTTTLRTSRAVVVVAPGVGVAASRLIGVAGLVAGGVTITHFLYHPPWPPTTGHVMVVTLDSTGGLAHAGDHSIIAVHYGPIGPTDLMEGVTVGGLRVIYL